ncbi:MAG: Phosphoesterase RecJ domain protein [Parcubacteria group bacterium GW2011_GWA2_38_13]|nr:MAG: Phosphoesterase RecJ domain protein [Parcubacteria group bacterium GW2011_GWA2_38_13]
MALEAYEQIMEALKRSNYTLVAIKKNFDADSVATACALSLVLKKMNKPHDIVCDGFIVNDQIQFLLDTVTIHPKILDFQKLIVSVNLKSNEIDQLSYDIKDNVLNIFITPKDEAIKKENIQTSVSPFKYDTVCVLDASDLESLGSLYQEFKDLFQTRPIINIDCHASNENYGQINYVNMMASSTSEILFEILKTSDATQIDPAIATRLLAGVMAKTKSFTEPNITPKTLTTASELIELGADRNSVVKNLFRNKKLTTLNLWGRVLAKIRVNEQYKLAWSIVPEYDFIDTGTSEKNLEGISDEFIKDLPETEIFILLFQKSLDVRVILKGMLHQDVGWLIEQYHPEGIKNVATCVLKDINITDAEKKITDEIIEKLKKSKTS